jgi:hypothetical protein
MCIKATAIDQRQRQEAEKDPVVGIKQDISSLMGISDRYEVYKSNSDRSAAAAAAGDNGLLPFFI